MREILSSISTFEQCADAGMPVSESYPEQCRTPDGRTFVRKVAPNATTTLTGEYVCLPHRNTKGPITLECALGIKTGGGVHYALDTSSIGFEEIGSIPTGSKIRITGNIVSIEEISSDQWKKYDIKGIMKVISMARL